MAHSQHELEIIRRWANAIRMNGVDAEILSEEEIRKLVPILNPRLAFRLWAASSNAEREFPDTTVWCGALHGARAPTALTSCKAAR